MPPLIKRPMQADVGTTSPGMPTLWIVIFHSLLMQVTVGDYERDFAQLREVRSQHLEHHSLHGELARLKGTVAGLKDNEESLHMTAATYQVSQGQAPGTAHNHTIMLGPHIDTQ